VVDAAPVAPPIDAAPARPANVIVTVAGVPDGTDVAIAGKSVGVAPGPVQLPRDGSVVVLTFSAEGYVSQSRTITPDRDQPLDVQLKKKPHGSVAPAKPSKDDIIDVFGKKP
jgi:hypothetical protein